MFVLLLAKISLAPLVWTLLGLCAVVGFVAVVSPRTFSAMTNHSSTWIDTEKLLAKLDTRVDIDKHVLPFSRLLGVGVLVAVGIITYLYLNYPAR